MQINSLMNHIDDESLPFSQAVYSFPCTSFKVKIDMMKAAAYKRLSESDLVLNLSCGFIIDGLAHDVEIEISTVDGEAIITEVK